MARHSTAHANARAQGSLTIGQAAAASGVSAKMIRHYEGLGIIPKPSRTLGNYRFYGDSDVQTLRLVRRARDLGFSMEQVATLVSLWRNRSRSSASVRRLALRHVEQLEQKIGHLQSMVRTLQELAENCHGDARPDCPILDDLAKAPGRAHAQLRGAR
jgi:MerR family transcriptional regulator, copper efflux regulator